MATKIADNSNEVDTLTGLLRDIRRSYDSTNDPRRKRLLDESYRRIRHRLQVIAPNEVPEHASELGIELSPAPQQETPLAGPPDVIASGSRNYPVGGGNPIAHTPQVGVPAGPFPGTPPIDTTTPRSSPIATPSPQPLWTQTPLTTPGQREGAVNDLASSGSMFQGGTMAGGGGAGRSFAEAPPPTTPTKNASQTTKKAGQAPAPASQVLPALNAPLDPQNPKDDLIDKLIESVLAPQRGLPQPRPFTPVEHLALGLIGGLDPDAFKNVIMPMLEEERQQPVKAAAYAEQQRQRQIEMLTQLAHLQDSRQQMRQQALEFSTTEKRLEGQEAIRAGEFQQRMALMNQWKTQAFEAMKAKVPPMIEQNHEAVINAQGAINDAANLIQKESGSFFTGGVPGGPVAGKFLFGPGGETRASLDAAFATVNDSILKWYQRRGVPNEQALEKVIGGALPNVRMPGDAMIAAVARAQKTLAHIRQMNEKQYPSLVGLSDPNYNAGAFAVPNPMLQPGDVDLLLGDDTP